MKDFHSCPNCNNITDRAFIYKCKSCGKILCSVCVGHKCPNCGKEDGTFVDYSKHVGYIKR